MTAQKLKIRDNFLKRIFLFVFGAAILGILIINFLVYPSFTRMLIANTEAEAVAIGQHMSRMVFSDSLDGDSRISRQGIIDLEHAAQEFNLYKLKVIDLRGETVFSTDSNDLGTVNDKDYFHSIVARGKTFTKVVKKGASSLEDESVPVDVVETYVPYMRNGTFVGALEVYLDITEKSGMLQNILFICNVVAISLTVLFSSIIMATLVQLDRSINDREKTNRNLEESNARLNREVEIRTQIQREKESLITKLQSSLEKVKLLSGFLPICASCKKIRDDKGYWNQIESYIRDRSEAEFSHGICPDCASEHYPEFFKNTVEDPDSRRIHGG
jgi:predicted amino acid-binding ACT domain protein